MHSSSRTDYMGVGIYERFGKVFESSRRLRAGFERFGVIIADGFDNEVRLGGVLIS